MPVNVIPVLASCRASAEANARVLDHIASTRLSRTPKPQSPPISKHILSTIFSSLSKFQNHVFVENDQESHFLYGLVLPLIARVLAVSTPGLLVVVQLPRPDVVPEWSVPTYDGYGSNASNGSKSAAPTTPSPQGTSRTPSPSDDAVPNERKSFSPDAHTGTEELIRQADKVLSSADAEKIAEREDGSPPPDSVVQDHAALRLICNGFEVLTGKMPPPRYDMGAFTLASVAWEKAGVLEPEDPSKGVSMSFSNGMMTPTEGIAVTFSNGSLCLLTTRDPLAGLDALKISPTTPVIVFSFAAVGYASVAELLSMKRDALTPVASRVRENLEKPNFFFVEIGHGGMLPNTTVADSHGEGQARGPSVGNSEKENKGEVQNPKQERSNANCPPILISSVPRAIPLFVNTMNQTFIDPPHCDRADSYEPDLVDDHFGERSEPTRGLKRNRPASTDAEKGTQLDTQTEREAEQRNDANERKENAAVSTSTPETSRPPVVATSQSIKAVPPVHDVVRMSQGVQPGTHGHPGHVYNYPYPPSQMYTSNPQNHHVMPHHPLPPMHQGQSMGNPYYLTGHTNGHQAHPAQYQQTSGYPQNGYYAQHVVPSHENWHRVPPYHGHGMPPHSLDGRRDVPAQFTPRPDGQYGTSYYPHMPPSGDLYGSQHMGVPTSSPVHRDHRTGGALPPQAGMPAASVSAPMTSASSPVHRPPATSAAIRTSGIVGRPNTGGEGIRDEKENALEALMHMRSKEARRDNERRGASEQRTSPIVRPHQSPRRLRRTETSSSTSTNSGGGARLNGAIVGHSHTNLPQKRRKR